MSPGRLVGLELTLERLRAALSSTIGMTFWDDDLCWRHHPDSLPHPTGSLKVTMTMMSLFEGRLILLMINAFLLFLGMFSMEFIPCSCRPTGFAPDAGTRRQPGPPGRHHDGQRRHRRHDRPLCHGVFVGSAANVPAAKLTRAVMPFLLYVSIPVLLTTTYIPFPAGFLRPFLGLSVSSERGEQFFCPVF